MENLVNKTVNLNLLDATVGEELIKGFEKQAKREGWTKEEITTVVDKIREKPGDIDYITSVLLAHANVEPFEEDEDDLIIDLDETEEY